jgi:Fur family ferric uptake transcriptional regulator
MIVEALHSANEHISAEEIFKLVREKYPFANISTVYRTLELLKEQGLAAEIDVGDGITRYHALENSRHHHLICTICGKVVDLPDQELTPLRRIIEDDYGFKADIKHLAIFGTCSKCKK